MARRLSRSARSILSFGGFLVAFALFPLIFLTVANGSTSGLLANLRRSGGSGRSPSALVLRGKFDGKGLDWPSEFLVSRVGRKGEKRKGWETKGRKKTS